MKILIFILFIHLFNISALVSQTNSIKYFGQHYNYNLNKMSGVRQTLLYSHGLSKKISFEIQVFTGTGRGKDISNNFSEDFILMSKNNTQNVPEFLISFDENYEGIHNYQRISEGLKQDNGWGFSINYLIIQKSKLNLELSFGYLKYNTKTIVRNNIIDLKITLPTDPTIKDYQISYPASIHMNYNDGAGFSMICANYKIKDRLSFGGNCNVNYSLWGSGLDIGLGLGLVYILNNDENE